MNFFFSEDQKTAFSFSDVARYKVHDGADVGGFYLPRHVVVTIRTDNGATKCSEKLYSDDVDRFISEFRYWHDSEPTELV